MPASGIDPKNDYVFKRLFGGEENALLLVDLLNAALALPPGRAVRQIAIKNPLILKVRTEGKGPALDVRARDEMGRQFHLEMQQVVPFSFAKRALYYWAAAHSGQMLEGDYYETLCPTYTICFVNQAMFDGADYHHVFELIDRRAGRRLCADIQVHIVELNKFSLGAEQVQTAMERWCYFLRHGASLDAASLPASLDTPIMRQALEVIMAVSREEAERWLAHDILVGIRDRATFREEARRAKEDLEKGMAAATEEVGKAQQAAEKAKQDAEKARDAAEKGPLVGQIQLCQQYLKLPVTPADELLGRPLAELQSLADDLKQQFFARRNGTS